VKSSSNPTF
jgi:hypothetical protein